MIFSPFCNFPLSFAFQSSQGRSCRHTWNNIYCESQCTNVPNATMCWSVPWQLALDRSLFLQSSWVCNVKGDLQERSLMESRIVVKNKQTSLFPPTPLFASRIFKPTLLEKNARSNRWMKHRKLWVDWIGLGGYLTVVLWRINLRWESTRKKGICHKVVNAKSELH